MKDRNRETDEREREMENRELLKQEINTLLLGAEVVVATVSPSFLLS